MIKRLYLLTLLLVVSQMIFAKGTRWGLQAGWNNSSMKIGYNNGWNINSINDFNVGIFSEYYFSKRFAMQLGAFYTSKGANFNGSWYSYNYGSNGYYTYFTNTKLKINTAYIEFPANFLICFYPNSSIKILSYIGPYVGIGINGRYQSQLESPYIEPDTNPYNASGAITYTGEEKILKLFDWGINLGFGIEYSSFRLSTQYGLSFTDNNANNYSSSKALMVRNLGTIHNSVFSISLGYVFPFSRIL